MSGLDLYLTLKSEGHTLPTLIVQGTRDPMGSQAEVAGYRELQDNARIAVRWIEDGDHSLTPRKRSGRTQAESWAEAIEAVAGFCAALSPTGSR